MAIMVLVYDLFNINNLDCVLYVDQRLCNTTFKIQIYMNIYMFCGKRHDNLAFL